MNNVSDAMQLRGQTQMTVQEAAIFGLTILGWIMIITLVGITVVLVNLKKILKEQENKKEQEQNARAQRLADELVHQLELGHNPSIYPQTLMTMRHRFPALWKKHA